MILRRGDINVLELNSQRYPSPNIVTIATPAIAEQRISIFLFIKMFFLMITYL